MKFSYAHEDSFFFRDLYMPLTVFNKIIALYQKEYIYYVMNIKQNIKYKFQVFFINIHAKFYNTEIGLYILKNTDTRSLLFNPMWTFFFHKNKTKIILFKGKLKMEWSCLLCVWVCVWGERENKKVQNRYEDPD